MANSISHFRAPKSDKTIVFWPCTLGDAHSRLYEIDREYFLSKNISLILFNPPGHGDVPGAYEPQKNIGQLVDYLLQNSDGKPLIGVSHSGGAIGMLTVAQKIVLSKIVMVSPVLDSRDSLFYMYEKNTIGDFIALLTQYNHKRDRIREVLKNPRWMEKSVWEGNRYDEEFRYPLKTIQGHIECVADFLRIIFGEGFSGKHLIESQKEKITMVLPSSDSWYPQDQLIQIASQYQIKTKTIAKSEHFMLGHWKGIWEFVFNDEK